jgi:hypothetical protein
MSRTAVEAERGLAIETVPNLCARPLEILTKKVADIARRGRLHGRLDDRDGVGVLVRVLADIARRGRLHGRLDDRNGVGILVRVLSS